MSESLSEINRGASQGQGGISVLVFTHCSRPSHERRPGLRAAFASGRPSKHAEPRMVSILDLPLDALLHLLEHLDISSLTACEGTCKGLRNVSRQDGCRFWQHLVRQRWGPVCLPSTWSNAIGLTWGLKMPTCAVDIAVGPRDWRTLLIYLEVVAMGCLRRSVKQMVDLIRLQGIISPECGHSALEDWHETLRTLLRWVPLNEKRRLAAFVCADWQPRTTLTRFLSPIPIVGSTPLIALRALLLRFPFLPIDAGSGADRVIGCFARSWVTQNAHCLADLGIGLGVAEQPQPATATTPTSDSEGGDDPDHDEVFVSIDDRECTPSGTAAAIGQSAVLSESELKTARDAVYTLIYSLIMLNTDLHNPAISPKIQPRQCVHAHCLPDGLGLRLSVERTV